MDSVEFKRVCLEKFIALFNDIKAKNNTNSGNYRLPGFVAAGELIGVISRADSLAIMESAHLTVFDETVAQRKLRTETQSNVYSDYEDGHFDSPPSHRS